MVLTGIIFGAFFRSRRAVVGMVIVPAVLITAFYGVAFKPNLSEGTLLYKESDYFTLKITDVQSSDDETMLRALVLDNLTHSFTKMGDPRHIEYEYEKIYNDVMKWRYGKDKPFATLTIGGGGYTFPRYMEDAYPRSRNDVVEIDPEVTRLVYSHLGMPKDTKIRTFNEDGRWYVMNCTEQYDVVFIDAYNDLSIPYHLTTREFAELLRKVLKPGGVVLTNIIDNFQQGIFLSSYMKTLGEVFGKDNVHLISISPHFEGVRIATFIVMTGNGPIDIGGFSAFMKKNRHGGASSVVPRELIAKLFERPGSMILSDNHVPVDNLIAPIFEARFGYNRKN
jgi:spermidine synthase